MVKVARGVSKKRVARALTAKRIGILEFNNMDRHDEVGPEPGPLDEKVATAPDMSSAFFVVGFRTWQACPCVMEHPRTSAVLMRSYKSNCTHTYTHTW